MENVITMSEKNFIALIVVILLLAIVLAIAVAININRNIEDMKKDIEHRLFDMQSEVERMRNSVEKQEFDQKEVRLLIQETRLIQDKFKKYDAEKVNKITLQRKK